MANTPAILDPFRYMDLSVRERIWANAGYAPQDYQLDMHLQMEYMAKAVAGGVGAAKTLTTVEDYAHEAIAGVIRAQQGHMSADGFTGRIAIGGPNYKLAQVAFNYLEQIWSKNGLIDGVPSKPVNRGWNMKSNTGVEVLTVTGQDAMAFAASPYTVVHLTEAMQVEEDMLHAAMERTARWPGPFQGMVYLDGTFEQMGELWYPRVCQAWSVPNNSERAKFFSFPSWLNTYNYPNGFEDEGIQRLYRHYEARGQMDLFNVRVGGQIPKQQSDLWSLYFNVNRHVKELAWDKTRNVDFTFDPGTHKYAGLFLQWNEDETELYVLDELVQERTDFNRYRSAWLKKPYTKNISALSLVVCDVASTKHEQGLDSTYEMWKAPRDEGGCGVTPKYQYMHLMTGLQVLMTGLDGEYYNIFIDPKCQDLLMNLREEQLDMNGELNHIRNKGKDDSRKALSYYLGIKKGTALGRSQRKQYGQLPQPRMASTMTLKERRNA